MIVIDLSSAPHPVNRCIFAAVKPGGIEKIADDIFAKYCELYEAGFHSQLSGSPAFNFHAKKFFVNVTIDGNNLMFKHADDAKKIIEILSRRIFEKCPCDGCKHFSEGVLGIITEACSIVKNLNDWGVTDPNDKKAKEANKHWNTWLDAFVSNIERKRVNAKLN